MNSKNRITKIHVIYDIHWKQKEIKDKTHKFDLKKYSVYEKNTTYKVLKKWENTNNSYNRFDAG